MAGKPGFRSSEACAVKKCHGLARGYLLIIQSYANVFMKI
jgi:hypothetical protein